VQAAVDPADTGVLAYWANYLGHAADVSNDPIMARHPGPGPVSTGDIPPGWSDGNPVPVAVAMGGPAAGSHWPQGSESGWWGTAGYLCICGVRPPRCKPRFPICAGCIET
jgi:hypothetical protein